MRVLALVAVITLAGCSLRLPWPRQTEAPMTIRATFEAAFMKGCHVDGPAGALYCECTKNAIEQSMTDVELSKVSPSDPRVIRATHDCAKKVGLQIRPGY